MPPETCRVDLQRNKTSLHIVTSVGYSIELTLHVLSNNVCECGFDRVGDVTAKCEGSSKITTLNMDKHFRVENFLDCSLLLTKNCCSIIIKNKYIIIFICICLRR